MAGVITAVAVEQGRPENTECNDKHPHGGRRQMRGALGEGGQAMIPPSPLLSARMMNTTYFSDTTMVSAQNTSDRMPSTLPGETAHSVGPLNTSFIV
jgi:hypothetical protein